MWAMSAVLPLIISLAYSAKKRYAQLSPLLFASGQFRRCRLETSKTRSPYIKLLRKRGGSVLLLIELGSVCRGHRADSGRLESRAVRLPPDRRLLSARPAGSPTNTGCDRAGTRECPEHRSFPRRGTAAPPAQCELRPQVSAGTAARRRRHVRSGTIRGEACADPRGPSSTGPCATDRSASRRSVDSLCAAPWSLPPGCPFASNG